MTTCKKEDPFIGLSHCYMCSRKYAESLETSIVALQEQVKALTAERDQACRERADAQHRYTVAMHDISKACEGTTARSACEVVEFWRKERDAQAEAVRVLAEEVNAAWKWNDADMYDRPDTWDHATSNAVRANPIARAAVERGAEG